MTGRDAARDEMIEDIVDGHGQGFFPRAEVIADHLIELGYRRSVTPDQIATAALNLIDRVGCTNFVSGRCWDAGRERGAKYTADAWCDACVARAALDSATNEAVTKEQIEAAAEAIRNAYYEDCGIPPSSEFLTEPAEWIGEARAAARAFGLEVTE